MRRLSFLLICVLLLSCDKNPVTTGPIAGDPITDIDGNVYQTVIIGNQIWTAENLRVTTFNDGTPIPHKTDDKEWKDDTSGAFCYYVNDSITYSIKYGALYNWYAINTNKLAPTGWRVPTDSDWTELINYLIANGYNWDGSTMTDKTGKSLAAKTDWLSSDRLGSVGYNILSNNSSGFSALPGGERLKYGHFQYQGYIGYWWSATEYAPYAYYRVLNHVYEYFYKSNENKGFGYSVRLVKN